MSKVNVAETEAENWCEERSKKIVYSGNGIWVISALRRHHGQSKKSWMSSLLPYPRDGISHTGIVPMVSRSPLGYKVAGNSNGASDECNRWHDLYGNKNKSKPRHPWSNLVKVLGQWKKTCTKISLQRYSTGYDSCRVAHKLFMLRSIVARDSFLQFLSDH